MILISSSILSQSQSHSNDQNVVNPSPNVTHFGYKITKLRFLIKILTKVVSWWKNHSKYILDQNFIKSSILIKKLEKLDASSTRHSEFFFKSKQSQ